MPPSAHCSICEASIQPDAIVDRLISLLATTLTSATAGKEKLKNVEIKKSETRLLNWLEHAERSNRTPRNPIPVF